jgi:hypothetical protein
MNYLANLQQALDFYRRNGMSGPGESQGNRDARYWASGPANPSGERMPGPLWAERMADRQGGNQPSDFFGEDDETVNAFSQYIRPDMSGVQMPERQPMRGSMPKRGDPSMRGRSMNYLAQLMGGR